MSKELLGKTVVARLVRECTPAAKNSAVSQSYGVPGEYTTGPDAEDRYVVAEPIRDWHPCDACGADYRGRGAAMLCCSDQPLRGESA